MGMRGWIWCKYCVHMYVNGKMRPVEIISGIGKGEIKNNGIQAWYIWYTVRTFANTIMYPQQINQ
jgi:hypothetical protein